MEAGNDPARFWTLTPREVDRILQGVRNRLEREANERMSLAWHIVALDRARKLPKLETLLTTGGQRRLQRKQTPEEHIVAMKTIFIAFGGDPAELKAAS